MRAAPIENAIRALAARVAFAGLVCGAASDLREDFSDPPRTYGPETWYHWVEDCVTEEGLVADFKAMADAGITTAHVFSGGMGTDLPSVGKPLSPDWMRMFGIAIREAKRNGLKLGFHNCPGWSSSGGPWIRPEDAMKMLVCSETDVTPGEGDVRLAQPFTRHGFYRDVAVMAFPALPGGAKAPGRTLALARNGETDTVTFESKEPFAPRSFVFEPEATHLFVDGTVEADRAGTWERIGSFSYRQHVVVPTPKAFPLPPSAPARRFRVVLTARGVADWLPHAEKAFRSFELSPYVRISEMENRVSLSNVYEYSPDSPAGFDPSAIIDLTDRLSADGALAWRPAKGTWRVLRIGCTATGAVNAPTTLEGLECDKLSEDGIRAHWQAMPAKLLALPGAPETVTSVTIDSYERGGQNWTEGFDKVFAERRGYPIGRHFVELFGYAVGEKGSGTRFLWDYARTVSERFTEAYYGTFARLCAEAGVASVVEPYGGPYDMIGVGRCADLSAGEFWMRPGGGDIWSIRVPASAARVSGKNVVPAEAFTVIGDAGRWQVTPAQLRRQGDLAWLQGVNRFIFHSYVHQPWNDRKPGVSLGSCGSHLNRHLTWWPEMRHWTDYVRRGQCLLQFGRPRAEALVLSGEGSPNVVYFRDKCFSGFLQAGYDLDFCDPKALKDLELVRRYAFVHLGSDGYLTQATLRSVKALLDAGVRVTGRRALGTPSLADDPADWKKLADEVYARVLPAETPLEAARALGVRPFADSGGRLHALRREGDGWTVHFLMNVSDGVFDDAVSFAADGTAVERWSAKDGSAVRLPAVSREGGRVEVRLKLAPMESAFIVLPPRDLARAPEPPEAEATEAVCDLSDGWCATFDGQDAPGEVRYGTLRSWTEADDVRERYFSGRARYLKDFPFSPRPGTRYVLDLGRVAELATVRLNGIDLGCLWEAPFAVDVSKALREGTNRLEVVVVNTWRNRLIGDAILRREGKETRSWTNWTDCWKADDPTSPAGLLGPVVIRGTW